MLAYQKISEGIMETIEISNFTELNSGENKNQNAAISYNNSCIDYELLSRNKELDYIDYLNLSEIVQILGEFFDVSCCATAKESHVCSVSLGTNSLDAFLKSVDSDPLSISGSTAGFSKEVDIETAKQLQAMKIKNLLAVSFTKEAFAYLLETDINIIVVKTPLHELQGFELKDIKVTPFGLLVQDQNDVKLTKETFKVVSQVKPTQEQVEDAVFAWKVVKHLKSRSAVIAKDLTTRAIIQGKTDLSTAVENAMDIACEYSKDSVLAIDGVIDSINILNTAIQGRVGLVIDSGDGENSSKILKYADKYELAVIFTQTRNIRY